MSIRILQGDCVEVLRTLPAESVHCCVTSPPYWGLRDYGVPPSIWGGDHGHEHIFGATSRKGGGSHTHTDSSVQNGKLHMAAHEAISGASTGSFCHICGAWHGCFGLEPTPALYVEHAVAVFREVRRVLRADATLWLNIGDSYAANHGSGSISPGDRQATNVGSLIDEIRNPKRSGLKPKDLVGIPWRVAFALQADGWYLRQDIIWAKPNPMPESARDRCTKAHEYLFLLAKSERYYFDAEAIAEPVAVATIERLSQPNLENQTGSYRIPGKTNGPMKAVSRSGNKERKPASARSVPVDTDGRSAGAVAGSVPWEGSTRNKRSVWTVNTQPFKEAHFATFPPALVEPCILAGSPVDGIVLDPFGGAGTSTTVADRLQRSAILIELNPEYVAMAETRITSDCPMFAEVGV